MSGQVSRGSAGEYQADERAGVPHASLVAQTVKHLPAMRKTQVRFLGQEDPLEKG